jgi:hypothetical protein
MIEVDSEIDINNIEVEAVGVGWLIYVYIHIMSRLSQISRCLYALRRFNVMQVWPLDSNRPPIHVFQPVISKFSFPKVVTDGFIYWSVVSLTIYTQNHVKKSPLTVMIVENVTKSVRQDALATWCKYVAI